MLDKIVLSSDRKRATVHFDTHSFSFSTDVGDVMEMVCEMVIEPSIRLAEYHAMLEADTEKIDLQLNMFNEDDAA